jgi:hypothetical protein
VLRRLPLLLVFVFGLVFFIQLYVPGYGSQVLLEKQAQWIKIVEFFALFLGIYTLAYHHVLKVRRAVPKWWLSLITLGAIVAMALAGFIVNGLPQSASYDDPEFSFQKMFLYLLAPLESTMFSLLAFYMASAAARAFRARNIEATLLLLTAVIMMLSQVTIGNWLWEMIPKAGDWIYQWPNTAARRAITIGVGLGGCATALKVLLGIERSYLGMK